MDGRRTRQIVKIKARREERNVKEQGIIRRGLKGERFYHFILSNMLMGPTYWVVFLSHAVQSHLKTTVYFQMN